MSDAVTALTTFDNESPTKPENLTATAVLNTSVTLTWTAATDNVKVAGYKILRDGVLVGVVREGVSFTDTGLKADTTYVYTVISFDLSDNSSVTSEPLSVTTAVVISNGLTLDNDMTFDAVFLQKKLLI
jgi:chitinase